MSPSSAPHPYAGSTPARVRLLDLERAGGRAARGPARHRDAAPDSRHVRAGCPAAPATSAVPRVPRAEPRLPRHLLAVVRLGGTRRGDLRPRGRVPAVRPDVPGSSTSRGRRRTGRTASPPCSSASRRTTGRRTGASRSADELEQLVKDDLMVLLTERFEATGRSVGERGPRAPGHRAPGPGHPDCGQRRRDRARSAGCWLRAAESSPSSAPAEWARAGWHSNPAGTRGQRLPRWGGVRPVGDGGRALRRHPGARRPGRSAGGGQPGAARRARSII